MDQPPRRLDPLAIAFHAVAIVAIVGIAVFVFFRMRSEPEPPRPVAQDGRLGEAVIEIRKWIEEQRAQPSKSPPAPAKPAAAKPAPVKPPFAPVARTPSPPASVQGIGPLLPLEDNRVWRYAVTVDPPIWRDITLTYQVPRENGRLVVYTDFHYAGGSARYRLGALQAGDPAHANVRFPGFFLHTAYIEFPLVTGQRVSWSWPWQLPDGRVRDGRVKQFDGEVNGWERVTVPYGTVNAARIDATINYMEGGRVAASARETIWLAPKVWGVVRVVREGAAPDESSRHIVAELAEFR